MNGSQDIELRGLEIGDLQKVAELHQKAFKASALSKLGLEPVRRYYEWQLTGPHDCYAVGVFDNKNSLLGFCFSGVFRGSLSGFLAKNKTFLIHWILTHPWLITNSLVVDRIKMALRVFNRKKGPKSTTLTKVNKSFGILSIAVDPDKQGMGTGKLIMNSVEDEAKKKGFSQMHLTVHPTNIGAIAFYEKCLWIRSINEEGNWAGLMIKPLMSNTSTLN